MASNSQNFASSTKPGSARRFGSDWDGSSVDAAKCDNITGSPMNQCAPVDPHRSHSTQSDTVMQQPVSGGHFENTLIANKQEPKLRDCWKNQRYLWNIMLTDPNINNMVLGDRPREWYYMLTEEDPQKLKSVIGKFVDENLKIAQDIYELCNKPEINRLVPGLIKPSGEDLARTWDKWIRHQESYIPNLRRLLEIFMIMQLELREAKNDLLEIVQPVQPEVDVMDTSTPVTETPYVKSEDEMLHEIKQLQQQNKILITKNESLEKRENAMLHEIKQLQQQNKILITKNESLEKRHTVPIDSTTAMENERMRTQIAGLQKELEISKKEEKSWKDALQKLSSSISKMDREKGILENKIEYLEKEKENLIQQATSLIKEEERKNDHWRLQYQQSEENFRHLNAEFTKLQRLVDSKTTELENRKKDIGELRNANVLLTRTKDELLTRLSKLAGAKLTHGNADIADLSDENRPIKIAEKFAELYDNEWTDALEELSILTEEKAVEINLKMVSSAYEFCRDAFKQQSNDLMRALLCFPHIGNDPFPDTAIADRGATISVEIRKDIEDIRRSLAPQLLTTVEERFCLIAARIIQHHMKFVSTPKQMPVLKQPREAWVATSNTEDRNSIGNRDFQEQNPSDEELTELIEKFPQTKKFAKMCANLSWLMMIRDPKIHMIYEIKKGEKLDGEVFRNYTRTGKKYDFLVWPALFLHEDGPLLSKGVAQPM